MPNGNHERKEYGPHKYEGEGTSDCAYGCGCWMGPSRSGGPAGIDPFGACPGNPMDWKPLGGTQDREMVISQRIKDLERRADEAERKWKSVEPGAKKLAREVERLMKKLYQQESIVRRVLEAVSPRRKKIG